MKLAPFVLSIVFALGAADTRAAPPHEHGAAKLDVAVDAGHVTFDFDTPLDNLLGFEHAPRTDAERQAIDAMVAALKATDTIFRIDAAAQCKLVKVDLNSAMLNLGKPEPPPAGHEGHGDLDGSFDFECKNAAKAGFIDVGLFDAFPRFQRLDVQAVTSKGQLKRTLKRGNARLTLVR